MKPLDTYPWIQEWPNTHHLPVVPAVLADNAIQRAVANLPFPLHPQALMFIERLPHYASRYGVGFSIVWWNNEQPVRCLPDAEGQLHSTEFGNLSPTLIVQDWNTFIRAVHDTAVTIENRLPYRYFSFPDPEYPVLKALERMWFSATHSSFHKPELYLRRIREEIATPRFARFAQGKDLGILCDTAFHLVVHDAVQHWAYETAQALVFTFATDVPSHPLAGRLPTVRYRVLGTTAQIAAIQMETVRRNPEERDLPHVPYEHTTELSGTDKKLASNVRRLAYTVDGVCKSEPAIFRPALLSLAASLQLFAAQGITDIDVSPFFPLRIAEHYRIARESDSLCCRIAYDANQKLFAVTRSLANAVPEMTIAEADDHLHVSVGPRLTSTNPLLEAVMHIAATR